MIEPSLEQIKALSQMAFKWWSDSFHMDQQIQVIHVRCQWVEL